MSDAEGVGEDMPTVSFLIYEPMEEFAAIVRGLPAAAWRSLERAGYSQSEISGVVGNTPRKIRRKEKRHELLDLTEGDRTMRLMRITVEAVEAFGDQSKALAWMRRPNAALLGKKPLEMIVTEAGTALVRRSLGVIAYGGVA
jgi:putative toxin-antitoxin system antitoxin component (TIGR02293 family)